MLRQVIERVQRKNSDDQTFKPVLFDASDADGRKRLLELLESGEVVRCLDALHGQLLELVQTRNPAVENPEPAFLEEAANAHLGGAPLEHYGTWVFFPWSRCLVHVLPCDEYRELRSDRNRYKITRDEQERLRACEIAVVGLSVGHSAALTLAAEGVGGRFRLADYDELSLSNLNRIRTGTHNLGLNKAIVAAREMFEIDPYLEIEVFPDGITPENLGPFLGGDSRVDLLIEECDDFYVKVKIRERARELGIPVVMDTSDRGMLDVERFDREPSRSIFHDLLGDIRAETLQTLTSKEKVPYVLRVLGRERMSPRLLGSLLEVKESLYTWPQLASGVTLGGAIVTNTVRRILLGEFTDSGRFYVDVDAVVRDGAAVDLDTSEPFEEQISDEARHEAKMLVPTGAITASLDRSAIEALVSAATRAPSAGNGQPWRFVARGQVIECHVDGDHQWSTLDFEGTATRVAIGAAVENLVIAARRFGLTAAVEVVDGDDPHHVATVRLAAGGGKASDDEIELFEQIGKRFSDRHQSGRSPIATDVLADLAATAETHGGRLQWLARDPEIEALADLMAEGDRLTFLDPRMHKEMVGEFRWTREQVEATRDGLDVATLELSAVDRAGLGVVAQSGAMRVLGAIGAGKGLGAMTRKWMRGASAMGVVSIPGTDRVAFFRGGRVLERVWLRASAQGVGLHPMTGLPYLLARLDRAGGDGYSAAQIETLQRLRRGYHELLQFAADEGEILLFRVTPAQQPKARSLRRHLADVLTFA